MAEYNILDVVKEDLFKELFAQKLEDLYDPTGPRGGIKWVALWRGKADKLLEQIRIRINCEIEGWENLSMIRTEWGSIQRKLLLPVVGEYIDIVEGRKKKFEFIPNTVKHTVKRNIYGKEIES